MKSDTLTKYIGVCSRDSKERLIKKIVGCFPFLNFQNSNILTNTFSTLNPASNERYLRSCQKMAILNFNGLSLLSLVCRIAKENIAKKPDCRRLFLTCCTIAFWNFRWLSCKKETGFFWYSWNWIGQIWNSIGKHLQWEVLFLIKSTLTNLVMFLRP